MKSGKHVALKMPWAQALEGSIPSLGTIKKRVFARFLIVPPNTNYSHSRKLISIFHNLAQPQLFDPMIEVFFINQFFGDLKNRFYVFQMPV
jgi:hypothetical protein